MRTKKSNSTKFLVSTLLIALLCAPLISMVIAQPDENRTPDSTGDNSGLTSDNPMLIASDNSVTSGSGDEPMLIQPRNSDAANDTSTTGQTEDEPNLIATNTTADNTAVLVGAGALAATIIIVILGAVVYRRKK
ncbi:MAG: hypothetical protein ACM3WQ_05400 [Chloroflexota bacterium]